MPRGYGRSHQGGATRSGYLVAELQPVSRDCCALVGCQDSSGGVEAGPTLGRRGGGGVRINLNLNSQMDPTRPEDGAAGAHQPTGHDTSSPSSPASGCCVRQAKTLSPINPPLAPARPARDRDTSLACLGARPWKSSAQREAERLEAIRAEEEDKSIQIE